jgi:hypothetical protein
VLVANALQKACQRRAASLSVDYVGVRRREQRQALAAVLMA